MHIKIIGIFRDFSAKKYIWKMWDFNGHDKIFFFLFYFFFLVVEQKRMKRRKKKKRLWRVCASVQLCVWEEGMSVCVCVCV